VNTKIDKKVAPVEPYDDSMWDQWRVYDSIPYIMDKDMCDESNIVMESGNIVKSYRCVIKGPYEVKH